MNIRFSLLQIFLIAGLLATPPSLYAAAPTLAQPVVSASRNVALTVHGDLGVEYSVDWSIDLSQWNLLGTAVAANGSFTIHHDASAYSTIYYRAKTVAVSESFSLYPQRLSLTVASEGPLLALSGAIPQWSSSNPGVATVDTNGLVKALAKGTAAITALSAGQTASSIVTVYDTTGGQPDPLSTTLIAEAFGRNEITSEQELIYRTYAAFTDNRLPAQFQGAPNGVGNDLILSEVATRIDTLSAAAQQILRPFLLPPIYAESWYSQQFGLKAEPIQRLAAAPAGASVNCSATLLPDFYPRRSTAHFNIYYLKFGDLAFDKASAQLADMVGAVIEQIYTAETGLLQRFPLPDLNEGCNGGDGAVDIYISPIGNPTLYGQTVPYRGGCAKTPSYIILNRSSAVLFYAATYLSASEGAPAVKAVLAHEFMHVLQLAMDRSADCQDLKWFDEATAEWAVDFVDSASNFEDGFLKQSPKFQRSGTFISEYLLADHTASIEESGPGSDSGKNGYSDYIFFQYLARKYSPDIIKQIFDAMAGPAGKRSIEAVAAALSSLGGLKAVWPEFAATLWNDNGANFLNYWNTQDQYDLGLSYIFSPAAAEFRDRAGDRLKTIDVDQKGAPRAKFTLLQSSLRFGGEYEIDPRSFYYEHLKFTDNTVRSVLFFNPIGGYPADARQFIKVQAWTKIAGQWKGPEDWTAEPYQQFCLDKEDERLEEMLIIVSNSEANRAAEKPFRISTRYPMQVSTSNVGCWQWEGSASSVLTGSDGTVHTAAATQVGFEVSTNIPGRIYFQTTRGTASGSQVTPLGVCTINMSAAQRAITSKEIPDGHLDYNLDLDLGDGGATDRNIVTLTGSTELSTTTTIQCPDFNQSSTADQYWSWLEMGSTSTLSVSADGQTIEGNLTETAPGVGTRKIIFKFTAKRE